MSDTHIDSATLMTLQGIMDEDYPELLQTYLRDSEDRLGLMRQAQENADAETLRQTAHSFKGSCGSMGAPLLAELCRQLEATARLREMNRIDHLLGQIEREFAIVRILMRSELQRFNH